MSARALAWIRLAVSLSTTLVILFAWLLGLVLLGRAGLYVPMVIGGLAFAIAIFPAVGIAVVWAEAPLRR